MKNNKNINHIQFFKQLLCLCSHGNTTQLKNMCVSLYILLYHFDWFSLGCDLWPDGRNFNNVQCWCDLGHSLEFGWPWEPEGEASKAWSGNVREKSLVVKKEWSGQSRDLITHWWQIIIEERREDWILQQFPSTILLYLSIWTSTISLIDQSVSSLNKQVEKNVAYGPHP